MVFFICDVCQETLKKSAVDKHCMRCRDCWYLSCVDCGKVFAGEEYRSHTSCISEAEKYQGALYRGNKKKNGKVDPQEKWMNSVRKAATSSKGSRTIVDMLRYLNNQDNIPRKEKKFMNYLKNSYRQPGAQSEFKKVWDIIYKIHNEDNPKTNNNNNSNVKKTEDDDKKINNNNKRTIDNIINNNNDEAENNNKKKKQKKVVEEDGIVEKNNDKKEITEWKSWKSTIRTTLRNQEDRQGDFKSIRKLVLKLYKKFNKEDATTKSKKELKNIFMDKLKKDNKRIQINDEVTVLKLI